MSYKVAHNRAENGDDVFEVQDAEGQVLITLTEPNLADELVEHLESPQDGEYGIVDLSGSDDPFHASGDPDGPFYDLIDPSETTIASSTSLAVLEDLLTHLNRNFA